jgi:hypothetical protein
MSAIPCASVSLKTMADGTLRISFDIEPMHAQDAFKLFAAPGTPAAIAALAVGYAAVVNDSLTTEKPKGGPLSIEAASMCRRPEFWAWYGATNEQRAADAMKQQLGITSRAQLDHNEDAKARFIKDFRGPFMKHLIARGIVT